TQSFETVRPILTAHGETATRLGPDLPQVTILGITGLSCHIQAMRNLRVSSPAAAVLPRQNSTLQVLRSFAPYLWPAGNLVARVRVATAVLFMIGAKAAAVYVPILYSRTVDALTKPDQLAVTLPIALIVGYGIARIGSAGFGEIRDALFASVSQRAVRMVAL